MTGHVADDEQETTVDELAIAPPIATARRRHLASTDEVERVDRHRLCWRRHEALNAARDFELAFEARLAADFLDEVHETLGHAVERLAELTDLITRLDRDAPAEITGGDVSGLLR